MHHYWLTKGEFFWDVLSDSLRFIAEMYGTLNFNYSPSQSRDSEASEIALVASVMWNNDQF